MAVIYLEKEKLFHLTAGGMSYVIHLYKDIFPMHLYWGSAIPAEDIRWTLETPYRRKKLLTEAEPDEPRFAREFWPFEYPCYGTSDFRPPAYDLRDADGHRISDPRYTGHRIFAGRPQIEGLPSVSCRDDSEAETLCLTLKDERIGLVIELYYTVFAETGILARHTVFRNESGSSIRLTSALSMSLDFKQGPDELIDLPGTALRERHLERRPIGTGETSIESTRGISSHQMNPFMALVNKTTTESSGDAYGISLVYSGCFLGRVSRDMYGSTRVQMGINPFNFGWELCPGCSFSTPEALLCYSEEGIGGMSRKYHDLFRNDLCPAAPKTRPIVLNTWEAVYFDLTHEKIMGMARKAAEAGVEMLVVDDGWFGHRNADNSSLGDWYTDLSKLPGDLDALAKDVNALGLQLGIWVEPEMISPDSDLYRAHPDWCIHVEGRVPYQWRNQLVLDLSREEVCDYIVERMTAILSSANISYVKWDHNRRLTDWGSCTLPAHRQDELPHRYVLGLYSILKRITERFPDVLFENCASGGARMDPAMMSFFPQTWISDDSDGAARLKIQYGTSLCYPPVMSTAHVSAVPNHQLGRITPLDFRKDVAFAFNFGYELDLTKMTGEELAAVRQQTDSYKELRELIQTGDFYRLLSPFEGNKTAWMTVAKDGSSFAAWFFRPFIEPEEAYFTVRLQGLVSDARYRCRQTGLEASGASLMKVGLPVDWKTGDFLSEMWVFDRV